MQLSLAFITPIIGTIHKDIYTFVENTFLKSELHEYDYGERFFILLKLSTPKNIIDDLKNSPIFDSMEFLDEGILFIFKPTEEQYRTIIRPFINGKYSLINREYVETNYNIGDKSYINYMILIQSKVLRKYWEDKLDVILPNDAEVWSKAKQEIETFKIYHHVC